jgi:hypothetical protein
MFDDFDIDHLLFSEHFSHVLDAVVAKCPVALSRVGDGDFVAPGPEDLSLRGAPSCPKGTNIFADQWAVG